MKIFWLLFILPAALLIFSPSSENRLFAFADEDELEDEVVDVENDGDEPLSNEDLAVDPEGLVKASPDADVTILFTKPTNNYMDTQLELPAGRVVEFLVGFTNKGKENFVLETLEASFRYPMDFTYYIQNFSTISYQKEVRPGHQATLSYYFLPSEVFAGRPFGLAIGLNYRDGSGNSFSQSVYNQTVSITEVNEGFDGETFFLYVFLGAGLILALVGGQQTLATFAKKRSGGRSSTKHIETGTSDSNVDYQWLPRELISQIKKSPKSPKSPKQSQKPQSPKQRKVKSNSD